MPVGRYARHTMPPRLQAIREKVLYKVDFETDGASEGTWYNTPIWSFADGADNYIVADVKLPIDRVMGTEIRFRPIFTVVGGQVGGNVVWRLDYRVLGIDNKPALVTQVTRREVMAAPEIGGIKISTGIVITSPELDPKYSAHREGGDIQFRLYAERTNPLDTNNGTLYLLKLVIEYTAYV